MPKKIKKWLKKMCGQNYPIKIQSSNLMFNKLAPSQTCKHLQMANTFQANLISSIDQSRGSQPDLRNYDDEALDLLLFSLLSSERHPFIVTESVRGEENLADDMKAELACFEKQQERILNYNRKDKSLSQLTKKFIQKFEGAKQTYLLLDQVTQQMKVQRRRIYDIINIMESLNVVVKIKKNLYQWKGLTQALKTIQEFQHPKACPNIFQDQGRKKKKQKSLESLATQFLKVFSNLTEPITLQQASAFVINELSQQLRKTKVRRLYDIVNVFKCMGLISKIKKSKNEESKPKYKWLGGDNLLQIIKTMANAKTIGMDQQYSDTEEEEEENNPEQKAQKPQSPFTSELNQYIKIEESENVFKQIEFQLQKKQTLLSDMKWKKQSKLEIDEERKQDNLQTPVSIQANRNYSYLNKIIENLQVRTIEEMVKKFEENLWSSQRRSYDESAGDQQVLGFKKGIMRPTSGQVQFKWV